MMWFVYILLCNRKTYYVGFTSNLEKRLTEHKNKESLYTRKFSVIQLVYFEKFDNEKKAKLRERQLKGWTIAKKKALVNHDITNLTRLSRSTEIDEVEAR